MNPLDLLAALGRASLIGAIAATFVGLVVAMLQRRIPAPLRAWAWWLGGAFRGGARTNLPPDRSHGPARAPDPIGGGSDSCGRRPRR